LIKSNSNTTVAKQRKEARQYEDGGSFYCIEVCLHSTALLFFLIVIVMALIFNQETKLSQDEHPALAFVAIWFSVFWLSMWWRDARRICTLKAISSPINALRLPTLGVSSWLC
jgi:hypothetical protein